MIRNRAFVAGYRAAQLGKPRRAPRLHRRAWLNGYDNGYSK